MDFSFTEEQTLLRDQVAKFMRDKYDFETRKTIVGSEVGRRADYWAEMAEMGVFMTPFPEEMGGLGGSPVDVMIVMEEIGASLAVDPYWESCVLGGGFLRFGGDDAQKEQWAPKIMDGSAIFAFAFAEPQARWDLFDLRTQATRDGGDFIVSGHKAVVFAGPWADVFVVTARTAGGRRDTQGVSVLLIDAHADGVSRRDFPTNDGRRASEIYFENVRVPADAVLGEVDAGYSIVEKVADFGRAALCAEAVGLMRALHVATMEYTKTRKQFGQPLAAFQVIQHRLVDMYTALEQSTSQTYRATLMLEDDAKRAKAVAGALAYVGRSGRLVGQEAVQLHGGMGVTWELQAAHHFKRLTMIDKILGDVDWAMGRFAEMSGAGPRTAVA